MFCRFCGASLPDDSTFCQKCGKSLATAPTAATMSGVGAAPTTKPLFSTTAPQQTKSDSTKIILIAGAVVIAVLVAVLTIAPSRTQSNSGVTSGQQPSAHADPNPAQQPSTQLSVKPFEPTEEMKMLYGNYDQRLGAAQWGINVPQTKEFNNFRDVKQAWIRIVFKSSYEENGQPKRFLLTAAIPADSPDVDSYSCHACLPLLSAATFVKVGEKWKVEAFEKYLMMGGGFGKVPKTQLVRIGPRKFGFRLTSGDMGQGQEWGGESIIAAVGQRIVILFKQDTLQDNCGFILDNCSRTEATVLFVPGKNPEYFDIKVVSKSTRTTSTASTPSIEETRVYRYSEEKYQPLN